MSLLFGDRQVRAEDLSALQIALRNTRLGLSPTGSVSVNAETALRHSAVWACLRLRADLVSTMPVDVYRRVSGMQYEVPKPAVLVNPGGGASLLPEWLYSSQFDLDRYGNTFGIITARDALLLPKTIELVSAGEVTVRGRGGQISEYRVCGEKYDPYDIWHEKQFTVPGLPVGLSPIAYAAWSIGGYLSAQKFANDWFGNGAQPSGTLRNTALATIGPNDAQAMKERFKEATANRDIFVTGKDWEFSFANAAVAQASFIDEKKFGIGDIARYLGVPGDMIDAESSTGSITYANVTQRNLQLLIMNLGPAIIRRETAFSAFLLPAPRYVKFNTDAILRMDPAAVVSSLKTEIDARILAPSEAREIRNRPPFTPEQEAEFDRLFGRTTKPPAVQGVPA